MNVQNEFDFQRNKLLNDALLWFSIVSIPSVALSWARSLIIGWQPVNLLFSLVLALLWLLWLSRNRTSYALRISGILLITWVVTYAGLLNLGPIAYAGLYVIFFAFIAILFLNRRIAGQLIIFNTLCLALVGIAATRHWVEFNYLNYPVFSHHPLTWIFAIWAYSSHAIVLATIGWRMMSQLIENQTLLENLADRERMIIANVPGVIYQLQCGRGGVISIPYISGAVERIIGFDAEALKADGALFFSVLHPDDVGCFEGMIGVNGEDIKPFNEAFRIVHPQQGTLWVEINATPERLPNNDSLWHGYIRDITALKKAENRLLASLENTPNVAVQWFDRLGHVQYWNHASEMMYGWKAHEAIGKPLDRLIRFEEGEQDLYYFMNHFSMDSRTLGPHENFVRHRDGRHLVVFQTLFPLPEEEEPLFVSMSVDITELKNTEAALLVAKSEAEFASKAKSEFLTHMSHELRTPLNAIIGFAQLLDMDRLTPLADDQKEAVMHILTSGRHLLKLINEILDLARIETGKLEIKLETVDLLSLIKETVLLSSPAALNSGVAISQTCMCSAGEQFVNIDPSRIRQVLLNLISNAIKYNRKGGKVTLSCEKIDGYLRINISDTGMGLSEMQKTAIFQPFQRLGAEISTIEGTGIGLALSKKLIEAMHGRIGFESILGVGSKFWIDLPYSSADYHDLIVQPIMTKPETLDRVETAENSVVYIEDRPVNIVLMQRIFQMLPEIKLLIAGDAETGLLMIQDAPPDLVLMDINLPGMSGLEALQILKADPRTAGLPIVAVSAAAMPENIEKSLKEGFAAYLTKPFDVQELISLVREHLK